MHGLVVKFVAYFINTDRCRVSCVITIFIVEVVTSTVVHETIFNERVNIEILYCRNVLKRSRRLINNCGM